MRTRWNWFACLGGILICVPAGVLPQDSTIDPRVQQIINESVAWDVSLSIHRGQTGSGVPEKPQATIFVDATKLPSNYVLYNVEAKVRYVNSKNRVIKDCIHPYRSIVRRGENGKILTTNVPATAVRAVKLELRAVPGYVYKVSPDFPDKPNIFASYAPRFNLPIANSKLTNELLSGDTKVWMSGDPSLKVKFCYVR